MQSRNTKKTNWFDFFSEYNVKYKSCVYDENINKCADGSYQIDTEFSAHVIAGTTDDIIAAFKTITANKNMVDQLQNDTSDYLNSAPKLSIAKVNEMITACDERENSMNTKTAHNDEDKYNCCRIF